MSGFLWLITQMLVLLTAAAAVFFLLGWRWRGRRARVQVTTLEKRIDDEAAAARLAREERDAVRDLQPENGALERELQEAQARQLSLERELLRLRDEKHDVARQLQAARADDFTRIRGIGPVINRRLHEAGVTTFEQLANLNPAKLAALDAQLNLRGRMSRENWQPQAASLHAETPTEPAS